MADPSRQHALGGGKKKLIIAVEVSANAKNFDCATCPWGRHCDEDFQWPGSRGPAQIAQWVIKDVIESRTCLLPMVEPRSHFLLDLYRHYQHQLLPFGGGILEQPNYFSEAMLVIEAAFHRATKIK